MPDSSWAQFLVGGVGGFCAGLAAEPVKFWMMRDVTRNSLRRILYRDMLTIGMESAGLLLKSGYAVDEKTASGNSGLSQEKPAEFSKLLLETGVGEGAINSERYRGITEPPNRLTFFELPESTLIMWFYRDVAAVEEALLKGNISAVQLELRRLASMEMLTRSLFDERIVSDVMIEVGLARSPALHAFAVANLDILARDNPFWRARVIGTRLGERFGRWEPLGGVVSSFVTLFLYCWFEFSASPVRFLKISIRKTAKVLLWIIAVLAGLSVIMTMAIFIDIVLKIGK